MIHLKGNLFSGNENIIAHAIFGDCRKVFPNAGFAAALRERHPEAYNKIDGKGFLTGRSIRVQLSNGKVVFHLITKERVTDKVYHDPEIYYDALHEALIDMATDIKLLYNDNKVAIPKIACGLDGGKWDKVEKILESVEKWGIEFVVYTL